MNLVAMLIPMLLLSAQAVHLSVIDSSVPGIVDPDGIPEDPGLQLSVAITDQGLTVAGVDAVLPAANEAAGPTLPCATAPCGDVESYDYQGLTELLARVKDEHPDERSVILVPEERISYEVLVKVMDAAREDRAQLDGQGAPRSLFPQVVMAGGAT